MNTAQHFYPAKQRILCLSLPLNIELLHRRIIVKAIQEFAFVQRINKSSKRTVSLARGALSGLRRTSLRIYILKEKNAFISKAAVQCPFPKIHIGWITCTKFCNMSCESSVSVPVLKGTKSPGPISSAHRWPQIENIWLPSCFRCVCSTSADKQHAHRLYEIIRAQTSCTTSRWSRCTRLRMASRTCTEKREYFCSWVGTLDMLVVLDVVRLWSVRLVRVHAHACMYMCARMCVSLREWASV